MKQKFYKRRRGLSCIAGLIDGSQVPISGLYPSTNEAAKRKGFHDINCQVVCDTDMKIFSFDACWPVADHDTYVLRFSEVYEKFEAGSLPTSSLLGDSGYGLSDWLLTPYANPNVDPQERYNAAHKKALCLVERCIGICKMRWPCLTKPIIFRLTMPSNTEIPDSIHEFLVQYATSRSTSLSSVLPLTTSLMGANVWTWLTVMNLVPCNVYMLNVCAKGGGKRPLFKKSFSVVFNLLQVMIPKCF